MNISKRRIVPVLALVCVVGAGAAADDLHYINLFVGDRAAGLGGAYTAIADGPEGAYYNPAGLAFSPASYISLSTNAVQIKNLSYKDIWDSPDDPIDYDRNSFSFVPNFFGTIQKDGNIGFALTLASTENEQFDQRDKLLLPYSPTIDEIVNYGFVQSNSSQELGLSWGILLDPAFSIGFGAFVGYRDTKTIVENIIQLEGYTYFDTQTSYNRRQMVSLRPSLGAQWAVSKLVTLGLSTTVGLPIWAVDTSEAVRFSVYAAGPNAGDPLMDDIVMDVQDNTTSYKNLFQNGLFANTSLNTSIGAAFFISSSLLVSVSGSIYVPINSESEMYAKALTWNAAAGIEWYITPNFPLRFGLFTNNANTPVIEEGSINSEDHMNLYGASLTFGYATANFDLNIGVSGSLGAGEAQILANNEAIQEMTGSTFQIFISGSFH